MEDNNILTPNIEIEKDEQLEDENIKEKTNEEKIALPDWDLVPPFETIDRSAL